MVQLIIGQKGKGKTKYLLDLVHENLKTATGNSVFIDNSQKHMYNLDRGVRLINFSDYNLKNKYEFVGFIAGVLSQDSDIEYVYFDNFKRLAGLTNEELETSVYRLEELSNSTNVTFIATVSATKDEIPEGIQKYITKEL
jgi:hypothetical protein